MAEGLNKVILIGNLGQDPELKYTNGGQRPFLKLRLATTERYMNRAGERQERTEWHSVVVWGKRAEALNKILGKGRSICVEGRIEYNQWEDKNGSKRTSTSINAMNVLLLGGRPEAGGRSGGGGGGGGGGGPRGGRFVKKDDDAPKNNPKDTPKDKPKDTPKDKPKDGAQLSKPEVLSVIKSNFGKIGTCSRNADKTGTLKVAFVIKGTGRVSGAKIASSEFEGTKVGACVVKVVNGMRFKAFGGEDQNVTFPFKI